MGKYVLKFIFYLIVFRFLGWIMRSKDMDWSTAVFMAIGFILADTLFKFGEKVIKKRKETY